MTCIVGLENDGILYFGGDSISVHSYNKTITRDSKVFRKSGLLFGTTGHLRLRNVLQYCLELPMYAAEKDPMAYLMNEFLEALHVCFEKHGFEQEDQGRRFFDGSILLGLQRELYIVGSSYSIERPSGYCAIGIGEEYAYGSLHATEQMKIEPLRRVRMALEAATCYNTDVSAPFTFVTSEENEDDLASIERDISLVGDYPT